MVKTRKGRYYKTVTKVVTRSVVAIQNAAARNVNSFSRRRSTRLNDTSDEANSHRDSSHAPQPLPKCPFSHLGCGVVNPSQQHIAQCPMKKYQCITDNSFTFTLPPGKIDVAHATELFQQWMQSQQADPLESQKRQFANISADPEANIFSESSSLPDDNHNYDDSNGEYCPGDGMVFASEIDYDTNEQTHITDQRERFGRNTFNHNMKTSTATIKYDDYTALQVMLMANIMQYRGVPLSLFDSIQHTIRYWAFDRNLDFNRREIFRTRESLLTQLKKYHGMTHFKADMVNVPISRGRVVGVVVFDIIGVLSNMFSDSKIFCPENIAEGYNIWDGTSQPSDCYGEVHTGTKFQEARDYFIGDTDQFPIPLIAFYDRTHTDGKGALTAAPFNITLAFLNIKTRMKSYVQFPIGIVPNLKYGLSSDESISALEAIEDEHACLYVILKQLIDIETNKGFDFEIMGVKVTGRPWIHFCIGDIEGFMKMLGCFGDNSGKTKRPNRMCKCQKYVYPWEEMKCEWIELDEVREARRQYHENVNVPGRKGYADSIMKAISRHPIETVWEKGVPVADPIHGMNLLTPPELLHTVGVGIAKYMLSALNVKLGKVESQILDRLHAALYYDLKRNSDRDYYESSLQKGSTESVKQSAMENIGNVLAILCLSVTSSGNELMTRNEIGSDERDVSHPLKLFMSCIAWFHTSNPKEEVNHAGGLVAAVLHDIIEFFERKEGNGWDIPKCHAWLQFVEYIKFFGNGANFWGGPGEHSHIRLLKDNARRTQKQVPKFGRQVAQRIAEDVILDKAEESLIYQIYDDVMDMPKSTSLYKKQYEWRMNRIDIKNDVGGPSSACVQLKCEGRYDVKLDLDSDDHGLPTPIIKWASGNGKKQRQSRELCFELIQYLGKLANDAGESKIVATGYSSMHVQFNDIEDKTIIRCTDNLGGKPWYDYVAFKKNDCVIPGKVCGILQIGDEKRLIVHATAVPNTSFDIVKELRESFLTKFTLGAIETCMHVVKVSELICPLIVFPDYGGNVKKDCVSLLAKRFWSGYFSRYLRNSHFWPHPYTT